MSEKIFGIDLGTTYSCVAYVNDVDKAEAIRNMEGATTTPSVVWFESETTQLVGDEAKSYAITDPANSVAFIKREMGTDYRRTIQGVEYSPEELSAKILVKLVNDANDTLKQEGIIKDGEEVKKAVITCPAYFGMAEKDATKRAGELAGLEVLDIINEPTAAAISYGLINGGTDEKHRVLIYDLGGGTFDVTVIDIEGNKIDVVCTGGDPRLGGKDWDEATVKYLQERWQEDKDDDSDITDNLETRSQMMEAAEKAKKSLTGRAKTIVNVSHEGDTDRIELTREKFDEFTGTLLLKTLDMTDLCIEDMKKKDSRAIDKILLVGGSTYMPQIKNRLEEKYGLEVALFDPNQAVAKGAAIYAQNIGALNVILEEVAKKQGVSQESIEDRISQGESLEKLAKDSNVDIKKVMSGGIQKLEISNVSSRTYGLGCLGMDDKEMISNFIFQNDKLPVTNEQIFYTMAENQQGVRLELYEMYGNDREIRDEAKVKAMEPVTVFDMTLKKAVPKGTPIDIKMTLNNSGLITINAVEKSTGSKLDANYDVRSALTQEEMEAAKRRAKASDVQ